MIDFGLRRAAEAVEEDEEENGDQGVDECGSEEMQIEPGFGLREQNAARHDHHCLMNHEEGRGEREPRSRVFGVQTRADGRSKITDDGFRHPEQAQRNGGAAETVLQQADGGSQQKPRRRIAAAKTKINSHEQGQIEKSGPGEMEWKPGLNHQRQQSGDEDRAGAELVHLDVRFADAEIKSAVHGLDTGAGFDVAGAAGLAAAESVSFSGWSVRSTSTSSSFSRFAAGLMRICLN